MKHICYKRPGTGFLPTEQDLLIGKKVKNPIDIDSVIKVEDLEMINSVFLTGNRSDYGLANHFKTH